MPFEESTVEAIEYKAPILTSTETLQENSTYNMSTTLNKIYSFFCMFIYVVGLIGGIGYTAYSHAWFVMVCVIALGAMATPFIITRFKAITE